MLSEFRDRLLRGSPETLLLDRLLELCRIQGWLRTRAKQRTDSTHIHAAVRTPGRLELVGETLHSVLNLLALSVPEWLHTVVTADWFERYSLG